MAGSGEVNHLRLKVVVEAFDPAFAAIARLRHPSKWHDRINDVAVDRQPAQADAPRHAVGSGAVGREDRAVQASRALPFAATHSPPMKKLVGARRPVVCPCSVSLLSEKLTSCPAATASAPGTGPKE